MSKPGRSRVIRLAEAQAGIPDITEDLALWRVFYGPHGGEVSA